MFEIRKNENENEDFSFDKLIINSFNSLFDSIKINLLKDLVDQNIILKICNELDENLFKDCKFIGEKSAGILYSELKELFSIITFYLKNAKLNFNSDFKEIERINFTQLINFQQNEIKLFAEFILLFACNCINRDKIIDKISTFSDQDCNEILRIIEKYINVDGTRESISQTKTRNSININYNYNYDNENQNRFSDNKSYNYNKIEFLEKEIEKLEEEKRCMKLKLNNLEIDLENSEKEVKKIVKNSSSLEEKNKKFEKENISLKKINQDLDLQIKRFEQIKKDNLTIEKYKVKLDEKDFQIETALGKLKEMELKFNNEKKTYDENMDKMNNTIISLMDYKEKYYNISEKLNEYKADTEKLKDLEDVYKDYKLLNKKYSTLQKENENLQNDKINLNNLLKELEDKMEKNTKNLEIYIENKNQINNNINNNINIRNKTNDNSSFSSYDKNHDNSSFNFNEEKFQLQHNSLIKDKIKENENLINENNLLKNLIKEKEFEFNELNSIVKILEEKQINFNQQSEDILSEKKILEKTIELKDDTIKELNENISTLNEKLDQCQDEIFLISDRLNLEIKRKIDDIENCKKENIENKNRFEKEFELIASSLYNLGLNYWSMKITNANDLNEKPSWLKKERKKFYDGDL
jgi:chromosome segregation ATPase